MPSMLLQGAAFSDAMSGSGFIGIAVALGLMAVVSMAFLFVTRDGDGRRQLRQLLPWRGDDH